MGVEATASAEIDACATCGGLWVDWFDGELHTIAAEAEAIRVERGTPLPPMAGPPGGGTRACPRCSRALDAELYRFSDARDDELVSGVELLRCAECAGAFVPRPAAYLLLERAREERPASLREALAALFARLFGRSSGGSGEG